MAGSGSIAAVKLPQLVSALVKRGAEVRCLLSPSGAELVSPVALASLSRHRCYLDADQWSHHEPRPLHIELAEWPDLVLLVPLSASTLARLVHGLADTLLASTLMATSGPSACGGSDEHRHVGIACGAAQLAAIAERSPAVGTAAGHRRFAGL